MNEKIKSPSSGQSSAGGGGGSGNGPPGGSGGGSTPQNQIGGGSQSIGGPPNNGNGDTQATANPYASVGSGPDPVMSHYHHHSQQPHSQQQPHHPHQQQQSGSSSVGPQQNPDHPHSKDDYGQSALGGPPTPLPGGHHPAYGRYHQLGDPYSYAHSSMQQQQQQPPPGGKPQHQPPPPPPPTGPNGPGGVGISSPSRPPPQRYIPGQPPQGPTPTLNSLLQSSHPPPLPQHRYANSYDPQQQQQQQQLQQPSSQQQQQQPGSLPQGPHGPPPPPHQPYGGQQGWAPPPRPYSPQMGPSQAYRTPPPTNTSRGGQSPYPPTHGQNSGSYPSSPQQQQQQPGGPPPPPPQSSNQSAATSQYSPYPQRYPTPPGPATGPNHRTAYSTHQYPEPNRPWPGGSSPAASPGPGGHPHPPASPHQTQHGGPSSSPGHAPSPSPQPSQASPSPHQELIGQNSNDSSSGGGHSGMGSGPPGTPNPQQVMRPTPSPTGSSGSRSMSPAVAQSHPISRPSSNQSSSGPMQQPSIPPHIPQSLGGGGGGPSLTQQQQPQSQMNSGGPQNSSSAVNNSSQQPLSGTPGSGSGGTSSVAQQQPPPPNQSVNSIPTQPTTGSAGGGYPPPPHMHGGYKMGPSSGQSPGPGPQGMTSGYPTPPQQAQQYSQGSYPPRPQYPPSSYAPSVPPPTNQPTAANNMPPGGPQQYTGRPIPNHSGGGGGPSPHAQFPPYQNWVPPSPQGHAAGAGANAPGGMVGNHIQSKGTQPPGGPPPPPHSQGSSGSPRPLNYLKQHLQHKGGGSGGVGGYGASVTPPQGYGNGPGMHPGMPMGPPHHMGPPHGPTSMGPPTSTPPQVVGGMLSGNIPPGGAGGIGDVGVANQPEHISQDNGISSSGSSTSSGGGVGGGLGGPHAVTSVVTTGPDGAPIDDVSQQSTLSNASAASAEDPQCTTPKSRKNDPYSQSHLVPPSTSPGGGPHAPHPGVAEEYEMNSPPNWTRTPASPVFNSHVVPPPETFRTSNKKSDSLCKLYEMDDNPERRGWLDKLRAFMEERRTPITACPTISKQPLDLYRLYIYVKERGGFVEVTKSKTWKDIAGMLGIGASSSAAYTLRKHYTKNLLAFECHFDRGDIDPLPIIQQVEAGTKKKSTKAASVPSPGGTMNAAPPPTSAGSSNSQDSFPAPGAAPNAVLDGYPGYPGGYPGAGGQPDYNAAGQIQRPPSQSNAQTPHAGSPYPGQPGAYGQYGAGDQYNSAGPPGGQFGQSQGQFPPQNRNMYPPYGPEGEAPQPGASTYAPYGNRPYSQPPPGSTQSPTPPGGNVASPSGGPPTAGPVSAAGSAYPPGTPGQQDYYRPPDQTPPQPRRHPDFVKDTQPYPGYNTRPQMYGGWQGSSNQYRGQYPSSPAPQTWGGAPPRTTAPSVGGPLGPPNQQVSAAAQWEQHRYAPQQAPPPQQQQQQPPYPQQQQQQPPNTQQPTPPPQWAQMGAAGGSTAQSAQAGVVPGSPLRPPPNSQQQQQQQQRMQAVSGPGMSLATQPQPGQLPPTPSSGQGQGGLPSNMTKPPPFAMPPPQNSAPGAVCGPGVVVGAPGAPASAMLGASGSSAAGVAPSGMVLAQKTAGAHAPQQQPTAGSHQQTSFQSPSTQLQKKEINFPPDSVEATTPVLYRRKRLAKSDICPIDPWRLFMALRSGLLTECTWALDVINVLLFDDTTVQYFGLQHLPGLLTLLLEHFQKQLSEMFNDSDEVEDAEHLKKNSSGMKSICSFNRKRYYENNDEAGVRAAKPVADDMNGAAEDSGIDLGQARMPVNLDERVFMLSNTPNYTMMSRKGLPVRIQSAETDIFVMDGQRDWDIDSNKMYEQTAPIDCSAWTYGSSEQDTSDGIIDVFKSEIIDIPFARYISRGRRHSDKRPGEKQRLSTALLGKGGLKSDAATEREEGSNNDVDTTKLQQTFNKKRRIFNNTKPLGHDSNTSASIATKKSKMGDGDEFLQPEMKKDALLPPGEHHEAAAAAGATAPVTVPTLDSDCREVDMEIEPTQRLANGYQTPALASKTFDPKSTLRDPALVLQRRRGSSYEDECYTRDEASLYLVNESQDALARRCICLSNIFRNLTFVPGNETILAKSSRFLAILGRLLLLNHEHLQRTPKTRNYDREEDTDFSDSCSSLQGEREWWWDYLISIRENMLVAMANIAGHLELSRYEELIARPLIDGLLHWAVCPSAHGQDPFPSCGPNTALSPQRLALESLCKLCVTDANVDLVIATPPHARLEKLCAVLTRHLCRNEDQVLREFSVNLLHYLAAADSAMARTVALQSPCISYLVAFIEQAEQTALGVANQHGINYLRENPDSMGTSLDMLRRAAGTLLHLAKHPDNRSLFMQQEQRLLGLVMSHILDQQVALVISRVLFQVSRGPGPTPSLEYRMQHRQQQQQHDTDKKSPPPATTTAVSEKNGAIKNNESQAATPSGNHQYQNQQQQQHELANNNSNSNCSTSSNASSSKPVPAASNDENSNSNLPPAATLNDVSNSSTNSSSCGATSSTSSHYGGIPASGSSNVAAIAASMRYEQQQQQQQHLMSGNKNNISTTATITGNLSSSNGSNYSSSSNSSSSNSINNNNNNNISNSNSNLLSVAANVTPNVGAAANLSGAAAQQLPPSAVTAAATGATSTVVAAAAASTPATTNTTAAVA